MSLVRSLLYEPNVYKFEVIRLNLLGVELIKNFKPQEKRAGIANGLIAIGESFFPIPASI